MNVESWFKKYCPQSFNEILGNQEEISQFVVLGPLRCFPNILITGPKGVGKKSTLEHFTKMVMSSNYTDAVLMFDLNNETDITSMIARIIEFVRAGVLANRPYCVVKITHFESISSMVQETLAAILQRKGRVRFILSAESIEGLIEPFKQNFKIFTFKKLTPLQVLYKLKSICQREVIISEEEALNMIAIAAEGNLNVAIRMLYAIFKDKGVITVDNVTNYDLNDVA